MNNSNKTLVITGNIGTGKSTVTKIFQEQGYKIISADEVAASILMDNQKEVSKMFNIPPQNFTSFKKALSNKVFTNPNTKKELESYMIPKINKEIEFLKKELELKREKYIIELPLLFEIKGLQKQKDMIVIMVQAFKNVRVTRILERNKHLSIQDVLDRIKSQIKPEDKQQFCDYILWNNNSIESLKERTLELISEIEEI